MRTLFEAVEEPLDVVALAIDLLFPAVFLLPVRTVGDVGAGALGADMFADGVCIITLVGDDGVTTLDVVEQVDRAFRIVYLASCDDQFGWPTFGVDTGVGLGGEAAAASSHTAISTVFLAPAACWCTRAIEASIMYTSPP